MKAHKLKIWFSGEFTKKIVAGMMMLLTCSLAHHVEAQNDADLFCVNARTLPWLRSHRAVEKAASMPLEKSLEFLEFRGNALAVEDLYDVAWNAVKRSDLFRIASEIDAEIAAKVLLVKLREAERLGKVGFAGSCYGWIRRQTGSLPQLESDFEMLTSSREFFKEVRQGESGEVINAIWVRIMRDDGIVRGEKGSLDWVKETQNVVENWPNDSYELGKTLNFFSVERPPSSIFKFLNSIGNDVTVSDLMISAAFVYHYPDEAALLFSDPMLREKFQDVMKYDRSFEISIIFEKKREQE